MHDLGAVKVEASSVGLTLMDEALQQRLQHWRENRENEATATVLLTLDPRHAVLDIGAGQDLIRLEAYEKLENRLRTQGLRCVRLKDAPPAAHGVGGKSTPLFQALVPCILANVPGIVKVTAVRRPSASVGWAFGVDWGLHRHEEQHHQLPGAGQHRADASHEVRTSSRRCCQVDRRQVSSPGGDSRRDLARGGEVPSTSGIADPVWSGGKGKSLIPCLEVERKCPTIFFRTIASAMVACCNRELRMLTTMPAASGLVSHSALGMQLEATPLMYGSRLGQASCASRLSHPAGCRHAGGSSSRFMGDPG